MRRSLKRALWAPAVLLVAASTLAACSSSGSSSSSSSSPASASGGLKKGLKVFVIPKNLGNPYFTTADSTKTGGALAALSFPRVAPENRPSVIKATFSPMPWP